MDTLSRSNGHDPTEHRVEYLEDRYRELEDRHRDLEQKHWELENELWMLKTYLMFVAITAVGTGVIIGAALLPL